MQKELNVLAENENLLLGDEAEDESAVVEPANTEQIAADESTDAENTEDSEEVVSQQKLNALIPSWLNEDTLYELATQAKEGTIVRGIIRSVRKNVPITYDSFSGTRRQTHKTQEETLIVGFENGVTAYCPASEFYGRKFRSLAGFVGMPFNFMVIGLNMEKRIAVLSEKRAAEVTSKAFMSELATTPKDQLTYKKWTGTVSGYNSETETIFIRIQGKDCFMKLWDWDFNLQTRVPDYVLQRGEEFEVIVKDFDEEQGLVHVSRKLAMSDPFNFLSHISPGDFVVGKVYEKNPSNVFVEVESGVTLLADVQKNLPEPTVGDKVQCRVVWVAPDRRRGKVSIYGYPHGKRKQRTPGSFLFD